MHIISAFLGEFVSYIGGSVFSIRYIHLYAYLTFLFVISMTFSFIPFRMATVFFFHFSRTSKSLETVLSCESFGIRCQWVVKVREFHFFSKLS